MNFRSLNNTNKTSKPTNSSLRQTPYSSLLLDEIKFISDRREKLKYCHVPKAASTTWMLAFAKLNHLKNYSQLSEMGTLHAAMFSQFGMTDKDIRLGAFKFTFIRHPFERIVSCTFNNCVVGICTPETLNFFR